MIKRAGIFFCFTLFLMCSNIVHSHPVDNKELQSVLQDLVSWIYEQNHFNYQNISPPNIKIINKNKLTSLAFGNELHLAEEKRFDDVLGLYNFKNNTIYISHELDINSKHGQSILLHELVHHFQYKSGEANKVTHISQLEPYAYFLERKFNRQYPLLASNQHFH